MNLDKIKAVDADRFDLTAAEIVDILKEAKGDTAYGLTVAFRYGFLRGQNAEKARAKTKAVKA